LASARGLEESFRRFPRTRYLGSKRRLAPWIVGCTAGLDYETVLDVFGGTGSVAYAFKCAGKSVQYNDKLAFNHQVGVALIENGAVRLADREVDAIVSAADAAPEGGFIHSTFQGIYFTDDENRWLDGAAAAIHGIPRRYPRALAWNALFQAALAKRPYNLFHRKNLYMRQADVRRGFGNKATWDRSFESHFRAAARSANAAVFDGGAACRATRGDALSLEGGFDLVYIDPPYVSGSGVGVDYRDFYHFLEGLVEFDGWGGRIDRYSKHLRLTRETDPWSSPNTCAESLRRLIERFGHSHLVVSYRNDGIPSIDDIAAMVRRCKRHVRVEMLAHRPYALSTNRRSRETLIVGWD